VLTAVGAVTLRRVYFVCRRCRLGDHPLDVRLGVTDSTSHQAQRLLCLAGSSWSFDRASHHLREMCGLSVSDNKIREVCQRHGTAAAAWQREAEESHQGFRQASGDIEFGTDGTTVNTTQGWREMRLGIFSKRQRGEPATADNWQERKLPLPQGRLAFAAIEKSDRFGARWGQWSRRLGIRDTSQITVLADGASWIWEEVRMHFPGAAGVLDIYHALEHVSDAAKKICGEGTARCRRWIASLRNDLLSGGWPAIRKRLGNAWRRTKRRSHRKTLQSLSSYLGKHRQHLEYAARLSEGRSIGSGQVEGACKHVIGRRLKQTGARWCVRRVNRMANLCCLAYSDHWDLYWASP
jgi:hypothetical protein